MTGPPHAHSRAQLLGRFHQGVLLALGRIQGDPQQAGYFFLDINDGLRLRQALAQTVRSPAPVRPHAVPGD